jgi:hypothetical protein
MVGGGVGESLVVFKIVISVFKGMFATTVTVSVPPSVASAAVAGVAAGIIITVTGVLTYQMVRNEAENGSIRCKKNGDRYEVSVVNGGKTIKTLIADKVDETLEGLSNKGPEAASA